ncbi:MAG: tRNA dimethylallyltransferase, partial [Oscillospiraceae bacterium]|nr:tRNA dimethylallyltransferase [Oscillospiraceae bacterium]
AQAIGYKELQPYIDGYVSLSEAVENLKRATRRYAKRQLTWFRRNERINWLYIDKYQKREDMLKDAFTLVESFMKGEKAG